MIFLAVSSAAVALVLFAKCKVTPPSMRKQLSARLEEMVHGPYYNSEMQRRRERKCDNEIEKMEIFKMAP